MLKKKNSLWQKKKTKNYNLYIWPKSYGPDKVVQCGGYYFYV